MVYKQYLHKDLGNSHYIYCLQDGTKAMAIANDGDDDDVTMHQLRRARIHVEVDDGKQVDQGNLPTFCIDGEVGSTPDREENYAYVRQYVAALNGMFPDRRVIKIHLCDEYIAFCVATFGEVGQQIDYTVILLDNLPEWSKLVIELEPMTGENDALFREPDCHVVRNKAARGEPMILVVEDYRNGKLVRSRELGKDEMGCYEIITEMTEAEESAANK